jgi:putative transposase
MQLTLNFNYIDKSNFLNNLCYINKNLYNQALYLLNKEYKDNDKYLSYKDLDKLMKLTPNLDNTINYRLLKAQVAQQTLKLLDKNYKSYFKSIKDYNKNPSKYKGLPKPPKYKDKERGKQLLIYTNQSSQIKDGYIILSKDFKIKIPNNKNVDLLTFNQIRIIPKGINNLYKIEIIYTVNNQINENLDKDKFMSIDLGLNNLCTILLSEDKPIIVDGKKIKSFNNKYNKEKGKLCSIKDKMKINGYTKRLNNLEEYRTNYMKDMFHKISRYITNLALSKTIGNIVIGKNKGWKDSINIGKVNNQKFVQIPYNLLINFLNYKCKMIGINLIITEESYTSKIDHLANEPLGKQETYLGRRVSRGLFQSSIGKLINADVNGAMGIMRKVTNDSYVNEIIGKGLLFNPYKVKCNNLTLLKKIN